MACSSGPTDAERVSGAIEAIRLIEPSDVQGRRAATEKLASLDVEDLHAKDARDACLAAYRASTELFGVIAELEAMLKSGADKVSLNTAAIKNPQLIADASNRFGAQCIVLAIDAKREADGQSWHVYTHGGRNPTELNAVEWARNAVTLGAGEILLTSMDADGTQAGYDCALTRAVSDAVSVPVIASGGAGTLAHFAEALDTGRASAVLAASLFHFGTLTIPRVKDYLATRDVPVRR